MDFSAVFLSVCVIHYTLVIVSQHMNIKNTDSQNGSHLYCLSPVRSLLCVNLVGGQDGKTSFRPKHCVFISIEVPVGVRGCTVCTG